MKFTNYFKDLWFLKDEQISSKILYSDHFHLQTATIVKQRKKKPESKKEEKKNAKNLMNVESN